MLANSDEAPSPGNEAALSVDEAPPLVLFDNITSARKMMIKEALPVILSVSSPSLFQFVGAHHYTFKDDT